MPATLGCAKDDLDTPALCVDLDVLEANIQTVAETCRQHGVDWRPHAKCHKSPDIGQLLVAAGAVGLTCAKLGEAEVFAAHGIGDLLIANILVGPHKLRRLVELCRRARPIVCVDHFDQAAALSAAMSAAGTTVRVLIEVDIGLTRAGVSPGAPAVELARRIVDLPGLEFQGLMAYEGHLVAVPDPRKKRAAIHAALESAVETKAAIEHGGIPCPTISSGGTGSWEITVAYPGVTEHQAGGVIFMDAYYRHACQVASLNYALTILTTVVSRPAPNRAVIDAGRKAMNKENHVPLIAGRTDIEVSRLTAEHGDLRLADDAPPLRIGARLELIPGYADMTVFLHDEMFAFRHGRLAAIWPIAARGKLQ